MFVIFLIPIMWILSMPLIMQIIVSIALVIIGIFCINKKMQAMKEKKRIEEEKYGKFKQTNKDKIK